MDFPAIVPSALSSLADLYDQTGDPAAQTAAAALRTVPKTYSPPEGSVPEVITDLPWSLREVPQKLRLGTLIEFAAAAPWRSGRAAFPPSFEGRSAVVELIGPDGLGVSDTIRSGLYLQASGCLYPPHSHAAEEFYLVLSGDALWQRGDGMFEPKPPGTLIHHEPWVRHAMRTLMPPLLAAWIWVGPDLTYRTYRIDETVPLL